MGPGQRHGDPMPIRPLRLMRTGRWAATLAWASVAFSASY
ncbi:MAG: hypothetical protein RIR45_201, partial [Pseudomonadota bacterium]